MKYQLFNWAMEKACDEAIKRMGFVARTEYEGDMAQIMQISQDCFKAGLNVMIAHGNAADKVVIVLDTKMFTQR